MTERLASAFLFCSHNRMKRLDHAELQAQLHDALRQDADCLPAAIDTDRLADRITGFLAQFDIFDPAGREQDASALPLFPDLSEIGIASPAEPDPKHGRPFARWLLDQRRRSGWVGALATAFHNDPLFPVDGDVDAVRARLDQMRATGDDYEALDDAELDWLAL